MVKVNGSKPKVDPRDVPVKDLIDGDIHPISIFYGIRMDLDKLLLRAKEVVDISGHEFRWDVQTTPLNMTMNTKDFDPSSFSLVIKSLDKWDRNVILSSIANGSFYDQYHGNDLDEALRIVRDYSPNNYDSYNSSFSSSTDC